jgi:membrane fusion protein, heavy metal efflux system
MDLSRLICVCLLVTCWRPVSAHEGHQPLPSKGVQIDTARGYITLSAQARNAIGVATAEVAVGSVASNLTVYAEVHSPWQAKAFGSAQISGRISKLLVQPGDTVSRDQVVAELSSRELEQLRLEYLQAQKEFELNSQLLELSRPAAAAGAVPMQRTLELEYALQQNLNNIQIARIRANTLGIDSRLLDHNQTQEIFQQVRAPIAGKIVHSDLSEGKFVESFEHLFEIVNNDTIWVRLQLLEKDISQVAAGQPVQLNFSDAGIVVNSLIDRIDAALDPTTNVSWAWTSLSYPQIIPGMVGNAKIQTSRQTDRLAVPIQSVFSDGLQSYVFVEEAFTKASAEYRKRNVVLGKRELTPSPTGPMYVEVMQGDVYPGDRVVTQGGHELSSLFFLGVLKLSEADRQRLGIRTATAAQRTISDVTQLAAVVTLPPASRSVASSQLPGTIHSHQLTPGQEIATGDLLMELSSPQFHLLQLDLLSTVLEANLSRARAKRLEDVRSDAFSRRLLLETVLKAQQLEQRSESLQRQLLSLGLSPTEIKSIVENLEILDYLPIRSAMNGRLASWAGTLGESIAPNQALIEIQDLQSIWIEAHVPVQLAHLIGPASTGQAALLSNPQIQFPVSVSRIGPLANQSTRTQSIWLTPTTSVSQLPLRDRMQLSISLQTSTGLPVLAIPTTAVLQDGLHKFVFVQKSAEGYIERRRVTTGRTDGQWIEVTSGLIEGENAIITGGRELQTAYASLR